MSARETWLRDLCAEALSGRLDAVHPRIELLGGILRVLSRRTKRNLILVGKPGVGKTALAESLAQILAADAGPAVLAGSKVLSLDLGAMLSGTSYRGEFEGRVAALLKRLRSSQRPPVLFVDEIHLLHRAGRSEGGIDAASLLKPALARGGLICLGASTPEEWASVASKDPAFVRRFSVLEVTEPGPAQILGILRIVRPSLEAHHGVLISDEALEKASVLPPDPRCPTAMPDRAIDRLDEACAALQLEGAGDWGRVFKAHSPDGVSTPNEVSGDADLEGQLRHVLVQEPESGAPAHCRPAARRAEFDLRSRARVLGSGFPGEKVQAGRPAESCGPESCSGEIPIPPRLLPTHLLAI